MAPCQYPEHYNGPLVLYGAGNLGLLAQQYLRDTGLAALMVIDHHSIDNAEKDNKIAVSVVSTAYVPIEQELAEHGYEHVLPFYDYVEQRGASYPLTNGWFAPVLFGAEQADVCKVLDGWADGISRAHHLQFIAWRRTREEWSFVGAPINTNDRYFIPEIKQVLHKNEIFVDGGAHHGQVISEFIRQVGGQYHSIVAFEPDPFNMDKLHKVHAETPRLNTQLFALAREPGVGSFYADLGYISQLWPKAKDCVAVRSLDSMRLRPTFIKLHLEGHELNALHGAKHTLMASRPIVAVTVYHNADGLWRIPLWLMNTLADYQFYFRLHSWCGTGAVMYAIPNERRVDHDTKKKACKN